jgi:hypothetical protein
MLVDHGALEERPSGERRTAMSISKILSAVALSACGLAFACSSSNSSGGGAYTSCHATESNSTCTSCIEGSCGADLSTFESSCSDFLSCACASGSYNSTAAAGTTCQAKITAACTSADQTISTCVQMSCATQCSTASSGGGSGSSSGSTGGTTVACGLSFTSATCATCIQASCCSQAQTCATDSSCATILDCYTGCTTTTCQSACVSAGPASAQSEFNSALNCLNANCSAQCPQ